MAFTLRIWAFVAALFFFISYVHSHPSSLPESDWFKVREQRSEIAKLAHSNETEDREGKMYDGSDGELPLERSQHTVCGIRRNSVPDIFTRIVGGQEATKHEFPWQASLQWRFSQYTYHVCGATVLNERWAITAAHCTQQFKKNELKIVAAEHSVKFSDGTEQSRNIADVVEHFNYNPGTQEHDISLIKVDRPFEINGYSIMPVCLPFNLEDNHVYAAHDCVVTGWGKTHENGLAADVLRKVVVPIIDKDSCRQSYSVLGYSGPIFDKMVCAGYSDGIKDACQGDSGGPLVCRGRNSHYVLTGIVSWGVGCARPNTPGVYTDVRRYLGWIRNVVIGFSGPGLRTVNADASKDLQDIANMTAEMTADFDNDSQSATSTATADITVESRADNARMIQHPDDDSARMIQHPDDDSARMIQHPDDENLNQILQEVQQTQSESVVPEKLTEVLSVLSALEDLTHEAFPPSIFDEHTQQFNEHEPELQPLEHKHEEADQGPELEHEFQRNPDLSHEDDFSSSAQFFW